MKTFKIAELKVARAGSDFLGFAWSMHVTGPDAMFEFNESYMLERDDGTSFRVTAIHRRDKFDGDRCWMLVDDEAAMMMDF